MRWLLLAAALVVSTSANSATATGQPVDTNMTPRADKEIAPCSMPDSSCIKVSKAMELIQALVTITGEHEVITGQGTSAKSSKVSYDLSGDTYWTLSDNIKSLREVIESAAALEKHIRLEAIEKNGGQPLKPRREAVRDQDGKITVPEELSDAQIVMNKRIEEEVMDKERPIKKLVHVRRVDLKEGENKFSGAVLTAASPVIDQ